MEAKNRSNSLFSPALTIILIALAALISSSSSVGLQTQGSSSNKRRVPDLERWPVADYETSLPTDPALRGKRQAKNKKYDKSEWPIVPNAIADSTVRLHQVNPDLPAFPVRQSTLIVIGQIASASAYLSNDKTGVYSEFDVVVEEVLKNAVGQQPLAGLSIAVIREGGRIRFPSGRVHWYGIAEQSMPRLGGRYVLFLTGEGEEVLTILTGYELAAGKVVPLDDLNNPNKYLDGDEATFLNSLKASIVGP
ncbi:MAG TPA: hypothetical protein VLB46_01515 [Pyrinomonadaceae bacterium]|nr:hypothetical protein [Pyrinomonadaceae bacterium]